MAHDVLLLHPPAYYDFRESIMFPGPVAKLVPESTYQFTVFPIGMVSIAEFLKRNGYNVKIANLGKRMIIRDDFNVHDYIQEVEADVYAVNLQWCAHSQGSIEIARLCKRLHPNSLVVLGGLTATCFHSEIVRDFRFIDAVIRGEAEKPFLLLLDKVKSREKFCEVPNLTYLENNTVHVNPLMRPCENLDEYEFTPIDLLEFKDQYMGVNLVGGRISEDEYVQSLRRWQLPLSRGCLYNCVTCGGSAYSYETLFGRKKPAVRSPKRIVEDLQKLREKGIDNVFLFQDPRILGKRYCKELVESLCKEKPDVGLSLELFTPADEEFLKELKRLRTPFSLTISPESGVEQVRKAHGRYYSNAELLDTVKLCLRHQIKLSIFFMAGLAEETHETMKETWGFWENLYELEHSTKDVTKERRLIYTHIGLMYLLDPGSLAFNFPERYGYRLLFKDFKDYYAGLQTPSWGQWISYETRFLKKEDIANLALRSLELLMVDLEEKYILISDTPIERAFLNFERFWVRTNHFITQETERILRLTNSRERGERLRNLREITNSYYMNPSHKKGFDTSDPYGYRSAFDEILHESTGLMSAYP